MKASPLIFFVSVAFGTAGAAQAQSQPGSSLTRAEVRQQLIAIQRAGFQFTSDDTCYPKDAQAAHARLSKSASTPLPTQNERTQ